MILLLDSRKEDLAVSVNLSLIIAQQSRSFNRGEQQWTQKSRNRSLLECDRLRGKNAAMPTRIEIREFPKSDKPSKIRS